MVDDELNMIFMKGAEKTLNGACELGGILLNNKNILQLLYTIVSNILDENICPIHIDKLTVLLFSFLSS